MRLCVPLNRLIVSLNSPRKCSLRLLFKTHFSGSRELSYISVNLPNEPQNVNTRITSHSTLTKINFPTMMRKTQSRNEYKYNNTNHFRYFSSEVTLNPLSPARGGFYNMLAESPPVLHTQDFLVHIHDLSGLPWWATIVATTISLRLFVTVPLSIYQNYILAKVENLTLEMQDIAKELKRETAFAVKKFNWTQKQARITYNRSFRKQWTALVIRDNCHPAKASILVFVQLPMWIFLSFALRNLVYMFPQQDTAAQITCLEMSVGGFLWVPNLILPDMSWILPIALGVINLSIVELQALSKVKKASTFQKYATHFFRVVSVLMVPVAASVPACMNLYWVTSSAFGLAQNLVLMSPKVKRLTGIPNTASTLEHPYKHIASQLNERVESLVKRNQVKT